MPSIFIWKSDEPNNSKKNVRCYIGSNWVLEDNEYSSKSYIYLEQIVIPGFNDSVITFHAKTMPQDWVGSDLLEVTNIPYEFIKSDNYGTLEKLGCWMRFTLKNEITFDFETLQVEFNKAKKWMKSEKPTEKPHRQYKTEYTPHQKSLDPSRVQLDFKQFLIKYSFPITSNNLAVNETKNNKNINSNECNINSQKKHNSHNKHNNTKYFNKINKK